MLKSLLNFDSLFWVEIKHSVEQVHRFVWHVGEQLIEGHLGFGRQGLDVLQGVLVRYELLRVLVRRSSCIDDQVVRSTK